MYIYSSGFNLFSTWSRPDQTEVPRIGSEGHTYVLFHTTLLHSAVHTEYSSLDQSWQHITVDRHFSGLLAEYWHSSNSITLSQSYRVGQFSSILLDSSWIRYVYHHPWESWLGIYRFSSQFYPEWSINNKGSASIKSSFILHRCGAAFFKRRIDDGGTYVLRTVTASLLFVENMTSCRWLNHYWIIPYIIRHYFDFILC